jgi:hypothetical protein
MTKPSEPGDEFMVSDVAPAPTSGAPGAGLAPWLTDQYDLRNLYRTVEAARRRPILCKCLSQHV